MRYAGAFKERKKERRENIEGKIFLSSLIYMA